jgi:NAD(P)-dependent dehydrogenase (short-subunit alcohol dehydrogenase family)
MSTRDVGQSLDGRVAVVTGVGGVGLGVGQLLLERGARVAFWDINPESLKSFVEPLRAGHGDDRVTAVEVDARDVAAVDVATTATLKWAGSIDVLALCHGVLRTARILELTEQDWDEVVDTNVKGRFLVSQAIVRTMVAAGRPGVIVDVGSFTGERIAVGRLHYCAGNAVMENLVKAMAVDLGKHGIRVVSISSGPIDTPLLGERARDPERMARFLDHIPLRRLGTPHDVAEAVAFVASDEARYWTGGSLALDGGWMAG